MTFSADDLADLATPSGGAFAIADVMTENLSANEAEAQAFNFCRSLASSHYENFPVASLLVPKRLRRHVQSIYAFARIADDIADEPGRSASERLRLLEAIEAMLLEASKAASRAASGESSASSATRTNVTNPVFIALAVTMRECSLSAKPFLDLLTAFRGDSTFAQPATLADLEHYCRFSANPVGELVLRLYGLWDDTRQPLSDAVCTGLQLANFWQDISRDTAAGRVTLPRDVLNRHGLSSDALAESGQEAALQHALNDLYAATTAHFAHGRSLLATIPSPLASLLANRAAPRAAFGQGYTRLRLELALTIAGGETILQKTQALGTAVVRMRPQLGKRDFIGILGRTLRLFFASLFASLFVPSRVA
jgi:squalene synthase HpnC